MKSEKSNLIDMNKQDLKKLSKAELIRLILKLENRKPEIIVVDDSKPSPKLRRPIPTPRKIVKQMVKTYEDNIIQPPKTEKLPLLPIEWMNEIPKTQKTNSNAKNQKTSSNA